MDRLLKFLCRLLLLAVCVFVGHAHAVIPKVSYWETKGSLVGYANTYAATGSNWITSCDAWLAAWPDSRTRVAKVEAYQTYCNFRVTSNTSGSVIFDNAAVPTQEIKNACPANSTAVTGGCQCNSGYAENAGQTACQINQANCTAGQTISGGYFDAGSEIAKGPPYIVCSKGCAAAFDGEFPAGSALVQGKKHYFAKGSYATNGSKCDSGGGPGVPTGDGNAPSPNDAVPPDSCAPGEAAGVVNGKPVCAPDMSQPGDGTKPPATPDPPKSDDKKTSETTSETTTNADGSKTTTTTTTTKNVDGTSTTTKTVRTTNPDGTLRSESTTTTGSGVTKEAEKEGDKKAEKCEKNSSDTGCGGDPTKVDGSKLYTKGERTFKGVLVAGKDAMLASPAGAAVAGFFNVAGGGSCPTSEGSFPLFDRTVSFSFDAFCTTMAERVMLAIKGVLMLLATIWAFRSAIE